MKIDKISLKSLGNISATRGEGRNADYFNIFSKSIFFEYDSAKQINDFCVKVAKSHHKKKVSDWLNIEYITSPKLTPLNSKKKQIWIEDWYLDDIGSSIDIKKAKIPGFGEGIIYAPSYSMFGSEGEWMTSSFLKHFAKIEKSYQHINIKNNKLGIGFFWIDFDFDFYELKDFFKKKSKENEKKFKEYMTKKYDFIVNEREKHGTSIIECEVPNGKLNFYSILASKNIPNSEIEEGGWLGTIIKIK